MSVSEILVIVFGLFIGYWVVSKLFTDTPKEQRRADREQEPYQKSPQDDNNVSSPWHEMLNVSPNASVDEIRKSYKILMHQYHPDKVASLGDELKALAERKSKELTTAYRKAMQLRGERL